MAAEVGIDLGTANVLVYIKGKGIVLNEPSVVAVNQDTDEILAIGEEARQMLGRTPANIIAAKPLKDGVISDYDITERMLKYFIRKTCGRSLFFKPRIMVCVPSGVTEVEKRAVREAAEQAGGKDVYLMEEPLAAAIGAGLDVTEPDGKMVIDIGGGTTNIAIISLGGIVLSRSIHLGSLDFDDAIKEYIRQQYAIVTEDSTLEEMKIHNGSAVLPLEDRGYYFTGRGIDDGLQQEVGVKSSEIYRVMGKPLVKILDLAQDVLRETPPELAADIMERGIVLTGGGSMLHGMDQLFSQELGVPVVLAAEPELAVARGTGKALHDREKLGALIEGAERIYRRRF